uniref:sensor histidine kinase n=1 Tax=uncultured Planktosalinus sp. TaxID=1810935 RepID=UPI0030DC4098
IYQIDESTELFITSESDAIDGLFNIQQEVNLFRIVQESFNNVIKHSNATAIQFELTKKKSSVTIKLTDNGKGFDFSEKYKDFNSLGLKTLKERTRYLNGVMKVNSETNKGTQLEFIIPYNEK